MSVPRIVIRPHNSPPVILRDEHPDEAGDFAGLGRLLGLAVQAPEAPEEPGQESENLVFGADLPCGQSAVRFRDCGVSVSYDRESRSFHAARLSEPELSGNPLKARQWHLFVLLGIVSAILRGSRILPLHGVLLDVRCGGLLFCGEGGVGKSTTARRWREAGGRCSADDMILLSFGDQQLSVQPLPTWSLCAVSPEDARCQSGNAVALAGVMGIARGEEHQEILPVSGAEFFTQLYSSSLFFIKPLAAAFSGNERTVILDCVREAVEIMTKQFPPRALFARLDGDLRKTLEDYL